LYIAEIGAGDRLELSALVCCRAIPRTSRRPAKSSHFFRMPGSVRGPNTASTCRIVHWRYSMLTEPAVYLNALMRDFPTAQGNLAVREFRDTRELVSLREPLLFNLQRSMRAKPFPCVSAP
jgi:hypothetical protein